MHDRPYTVLSCCMSIDGYVGTGTERRLMLSNDADFDRVDSLRATSDAILVGAGTVRSDDPRLLVRSAARREERVRQGRAPSPMKVTMTSTGQLDPRSRFFTAGDTERLVYCPTSALGETRSRVGAAATVVDAGGRLDMGRLVRDLRARGVERLMVEGGGTVLTQFLTEGVVDELSLAVAPFFVGDRRARRLVDDGAFPWSADRRATLADVRPVGDVVVMTYALTRRFEREHLDETLLSTAAR